MKSGDGDNHGAVERAGNRKKKRNRKASGRRLLTGIYRVGECVLFVPSLPMFAAREHIAARRRDGAQSLRALLRGAPIGRSAVDSWLELFRGEDWFKPWLIECIEPNDVQIPTRSEVERMMGLCNYSKRMIGIAQRGWKEYTRYFGKGERFGFPEKDITKWVRFLYGDPIPSGWVLLSELAMAVRNQLTRGAICAAAGIDQATFTRWKTDQTVRTALAAAVARREGGGKSPAGNRDWDALRGTASAFNVAKRKRVMLKWAAEATERRAIARAKAADPSLQGAISGLRNKARDAGRLESLNAYIGEFIARLPEAPSAACAKGIWFRRGAVAEGLFSPLPWMRKFQDESKSVHHALQIGAIERRLGVELWELWFADWCLPLETRASKSVRRYRLAAGLVRPNKRSPWRTHPPARVAAVSGDLDQVDIDAAPIDQERLRDALEGCGEGAKFERQRSLLRAVAALTAGRVKSWPTGKQIARAASTKYNSNMRSALKKLCDRGCLRSQGRGYRLA